MKPAAVDLAGATDAPDALRRVAGVRFAEASALAGAMHGGDSEALHRFRIGCKRLRYALERLATIAPVFEATAAQFERIQDALGEVHDCDLLLTQLPPPMVKTRARLKTHRLESALHASRLWTDALVLFDESLRFHDARASGAPAPEVVDESAAADHERGESEHLRDG